MATATWTQVLAHTEAASFRVWGKKVSDSLQAMSGLVKTGDTGQIDWTTVAFPGTSTNGGYEIYYLNDSLHATAPLYFRIDYGTGVTTTRARIQLTVGTATNGAGTLSGTALTSTVTTSVSATMLATTGATSFLCVREGFIGFVGWTEGIADNISAMGFAIVRTCDTDGVPDVTGATVFTHSTSSSAAVAGYCQHLRFAATAAAYTRSNTALAIHIPHAELLTAVAGVPQAYLGWQHTPNMQPSHAFCGVLFTEVPFGTAFTATLVGSTSRTYVNVLGGNGAMTNAPAPATFGCAMIWE